MPTVVVPLPLLLSCSRSLDSAEVARKPSRSLEEHRSTQPNTTSPFPTSSLALSHTDKRWHLWEAKRARRGDVYVPKPPPTVPTRSAHLRLPQTLLHLPPNVLHLIFRQSISHCNFTLSQELLSQTLSALYFYVDLRSLYSLAQFAAALVQRPRLADAVVHLRLGVDEMDAEEVGWDIGTVGKGMLGDAIERRRGGFCAALSSLLT